MQITDKDLQLFRERAMTELQSNGAVGRLAWDVVVNALCNEVEELRKNAAISNSVDSAWSGVCAACAEGTPPERCAYYGDPDGCNAPVRGHHPAGDVAERLKDELADAHDAIAILEAELAEARRERDSCAAENSLLARPQTGNAAKTRKALSDACYAMHNFLKTQNGGYEEMAIALDKAKAALAAPPRNCDRFATAEEAYSAWMPAVEMDAICDWLFATAKEGGAE